MEYRAENGAIVTDEMLDRMAEEYENGTWSGHGKVAQGRPRIYDEDMETVSFRIPKSRIAAIEVVAKKRGESKSEFFREAIDMALLAGA